MNLSALNNFDFLVLTIVGLSVLFGFMKGFIRSALSLLGWFIAAYGAYSVFPQAKPFLLEHFHNEIVINVVGPVAVFFAIMIVLSIVSYQFVHALGDICGGGIDRSLGLAFGLGRGALIVSIMFSGLTMVAPGLGPEKTKDTYHEQAVEAEREAPNWLRQAQTYNLLKIGSNMFLANLPEGIIDKVQQVVGNAKGVNTEQVPPSQVGLVVKQMQGLIPADMHINESVLEGLKKMPDASNKQKESEIFRIVLDAYKSAVKSGRIPQNKALPEEKIKAFEDAIFSAKSSAIEMKAGGKQNANKNAGGTMAGYDKKQINEFDRLMQTVQ